MREDHGDGQTAAVDPGRARRGHRAGDARPSRLDAEIASRERSKRVRLLKAAGFPNAKDIEGYDWSNLRMPADWGRAQLETLDFIDRCEDLVLYGPVGTGKTHHAVD